MSIDAALERVLATRRQHLNRRVAALRLQHPGFDPAHWAQCLRETVEPLAQALAAAAPERAAPAVLVAAESALLLVARGLAGPAARVPWVEIAWRGIAVGMPTLLAAQPRRVLAMLANAVLALDAVPGVRVNAWIASLSRLAPRIVDVGQLAGLGQLAAWRAGMAHYRQGALRAAVTLDPALALEALGFAPDGDWPHCRAALLDDPWHDPSGTRWQPPGGALALGAFSGFGGAFPAPPRLARDAAGVIAMSAGRGWRVHADRFGAVLLPLAALPEAPVPATEVAPPPDLLAAWHWPRAGVTGASDGRTLVLATPFSHHLAVLPCP